MSTMGEPDAHAFWTEGWSRSEHAFRRAARHSRHVRVLRVALPVGIVAIFAVIVIAAYVKPFQVLGNLPLDPGKLVVAGTKITMEAPRLAGYTNDNRPYELTARAASQDLTKPGVIELSDVQAQIRMQDSGTVNLTAVTGIYDSKADVLKLHEKIHLTSSSGYEAWLSEAVVEVKKGTIVSEKPVQVKLTGGTVNANRLEVSENGALVSFQQGVETYLSMEHAAPAAPAAASEPVTSSITPATPIQPAPQPAPRATQARPSSQHKASAR
jgi:lipopolysaccharide export system protein LptC